MKQKPRKARETRAAYRVKHVSRVNKSNMSREMLKFNTRVRKNGRVELDVPLPEGTRVSVLVAKSKEDFKDLALAAQSSLTFWDNPIDDAEWNNA